MTVEKPKPKQLLRSITTGANSAMSQSQFLAITCNSLKGRKNHAYMVRLVLVLLLIGWKTGASLLSQSLSVAIAITRLLSTVIWKLLYQNLLSYPVDSVHWYLSSALHPLSDRPFTFPDIVCDLRTKQLGTTQTIPLTSFTTEASD